MTYREAIDFLYSTAPMFQTVGKQAYKTGLDNTHLLDQYFGYPHRKFATVHIGGTNGKGSTTHMLAAILQKAGYKVGLYTSPHLKDFRERVKINGEMISKQKVSAFVKKHQDLICNIQPSFFEITTALAFNYFAEQKIDIALVEVGLGGRLDCTNIISPKLSIITNISLDHTDLLGESIEKIAMEKSGIIKPNTTVVIGETDDLTKDIFINKATSQRSKIVFADQKYNKKSIPNCQLKGYCQQKNIKTVLACVDELICLGYKIEQENILQGLEKVTEITGLMGRWQTIGENPKTICDTGHNHAGISLIVEQINAQKYNHLHIVFGMMADKERTKIYELLPKDATYYFTKASLPRSLNEVVLMGEAKEFGLNGRCYSTVRKALAAARRKAEADDFIYVGGSTFVVADAL